MMMNSTRLCFFGLFMTFASALFAQSSSLFLKLQLMPDGESWGVYVKPGPDIDPSSNTITGSAQVTLVVPVGFEIEDFSSISGLWTNNALVEGPVENPTMSYISFGLVTDNPPINYASGEETLLFTFASPSGCQDTMHLIENGQDPFDQLPNSMNTNPGNEITVIDFAGGSSIYNYGGNYALSAWSCQDCDNDGTPNALEDTNGDGQWTPGVDASDLCGGSGGCTYPVFLQQPQNFIACVGETALLTGQAGDLTYHWQASADGGATWSDLTDDATYTGAATNSLFIETNTSLHNNQYRLIAVNGLCETSSNAVELYLEGPVEVTGQPASQSVCAGGEATFEATVAAPNGVVEYQWQVSANGFTWIDIDATLSNGVYAGFNDKILKISDVTGLNNLKYRLRAHTGQCQAVLSQSANLSVGSLLAIESQPEDFTTCDGNTASFTAEISNAGNAQFQWQESTDGGITWADLSDDQVFGGAQTETLSIADLTGKAGNRYRLLASTVECGSVESEAATLQVGDGLAFNSQPDSGVFCPVGEACFSASVNSPAATFQWQIQSPGQSSWQNLSNNFIFSGAQTAQLCINNPLNLAGISLRVLASSDCGDLASEPALLEIQDDLAVLDQPDDLTICQGETAHFEADLERLCGYDATVFAWEATADGTVFTEIANAFDQPYILDLLQLSGKIILDLPADEYAGGLGYRLRITTPTQDYFTEIAWLTVEGPVTFDLQPADETTCAGSDAYLTAHAKTESGEGDLVYQWEGSADGLNWEEIAGDQNISGTTSEELQISDISQTGFRHFRCKARTVACGWVISAAAKVVVEGPLSFIQQPVDITVCTGSFATFKVEVENESGEGILDYQWDLSTDGGQSWIQGWIFSHIDSATLTFPTAPHFNGNMYRVRVKTHACGWVISEPALLTLQLLQATDSPENAATCPDDAHTFHAAISVATGGEPDFGSMQWQMSSDGGDSWTFILENQETGFGGEYSGVLTNDLTISRTEGLDGYQFRLFGATDICERTTQAATLTVDDSLCPDPIEYDCMGMSLKWLPGQQRWAVFVRPEGFTPPAYTTASSGRVTIVAPIGFTYTQLISEAGGTWTPGTVLFNPPKAPGMAFLTFNLTPSQNQLLLEEGEEIMLFSIQKVGSCPQTIYLMDEYVPQPLQPNEFAGTGLGLGFGPDVHFHLCGVYDRQAALCNPGQLLTPGGTQQSGFETAFEKGEKFSLAPNPAGAWTDVIFENEMPEAPSAIRLLNLQGQIVRQQPVSAERQQLDLDGLAPGFYFVALESEGQILQREKLIKY